jgi:hypothetical protein
MKKYIIVALVLVLTKTAPLRAHNLTQEDLKTEKALIEKLVNQELERILGHHTSDIIINDGRQLPERKMAILRAIFRVTITLAAIACCCWICLYVQELSKRISELEAYHRLRLDTPPQMGFWGDLAEKQELADRALSVARDQVWAEFFSKPAVDYSNYWAGHGPNEEED